MAAWRAAADHPADRAVLASLSRFGTKGPASGGVFLLDGAAVPGKAQVEDNVASGVAGRLPPIPRIN